MRNQSLIVKPKRNFASVETASRSRCCRISMLPSLRARAPRVEQRGEIGAVDVSIGHEIESR